ncbi:MAG: hypothetical protein HKO02_09530 [Hyphomonadaceae bacterium]|nr:hypothetical protein [Hyphomonadaceae bacterium]
MSASQFKKIERVAEAAPDQIDSIIEDATLNGSLVTPSVSLFHRLPKITQKSEYLTDAAYKPSNGQISDDIEGTSYEDGLRDGRKEASLVYLDTIKLLETSLQSLNDQYQLIRSEIEMSHFKAVATTLKAILPQLAERSAVSQIQALVKDLCSGSIDVSIRLHINPGQVDQINMLVNSDQERESLVKIIPDHKIDLGNIRCDWEGGGVEIDTNSVVQQCLAILDSALVNEIQNEGQDHG